MERLKQRLELALQEHQQESSLHLIGGRAKLLERLLDALHDALPEPDEPASPAINGPCVP